MPNIITFFSLFFFFFCSHKPSPQTFVPVGDLSMSDQGVLPKLISNITSDLSRAPDLLRPRAMWRCTRPVLRNRGRWSLWACILPSAATFHPPCSRGLQARRITPLYLSAQPEYQPSRSLSQSLLGIAAAAENATCRSRVVYYHCA